MTVTDAKTNFVATCKFAFFSTNLPTIPLIYLLTRQENPIYTGTQSRHRFNIFIGT